MAALNPWETDSSADDFVAAVTTLNDAALVMFQIADPNNTEQGLWRKITGANLKAAINPAPTIIFKSNIGTTYADISTHPFNNNDIVLITLSETQTNSERGTVLLITKFGDLHTSQATTSTIEWAGSGARLQVIKSGQKIQARYSGPFGSSNKLMAMVIGQDPA